MRIPVNRHFCYESQAHCAAVVEESASHSLVVKEDALPLFVAFAAGSTTYHIGYGIIAALIASAMVAIATIAIAQIALGLAKSDLARANIGGVFALPAALAGYHAIHGIAVATMPAGSWQAALSFIGAALIAAASWTQWAHTRA